jgi:hypothetical protein
MIRQVSWRELEVQRGSAAGVTRRRSAKQNYAVAQQVFLARRLPALSFVCLDQPRLA